MTLAIVRALALYAALWSGYACALDSTPSPSQIPYKAEGTPLEEHGSRVGLGLLIFLAVSGGAIFLIRKKIPPLGTGGDGDVYLKIVKRAYLNPRASLYVVEFNQKTLLIGQSGDHLVCLDKSPQTKTQDVTDV